MQLYTFDKTVRVESLKDGISHFVSWTFTKKSDILVRKGGHEMNQVKIGNFLKELRKEKALTQEQLAEQFNVSSRTVSRWENGNNMPDISILIMLSEFYDVDIREIIDGERKTENMNKETKDTLVKVAEYTAAEKEKILKQLLYNTIIAFFSVVAVFIALPFQTGEISYTVIVFIQIGIIMTGASIINILQIKGSMSKSKLKKLRRIGIPVCIIVVLLAIILIICLVGLLLS